MKKVVLFFSVSLCLVCCRKPVSDTSELFPEVKTVSATQLQGDTIEVVGEIISEGTAPLTYLGFCLSDEPNPELIDNQLQGAFNGQYFFGIYTDLQLGQQYYIKAWAANDNGYKTGQEISIIL
jgi:hypothetical protein